MRSDPPYYALPDDDGDGDEDEAALSYDFAGYEELDVLRQLSTVDDVAAMAEMAEQEFRRPSRSKSGVRTKSSVYKKFGLNASVNMCSSNLLMILVVCYTVAAANEYWLINFLKQEGVSLPILFALLQNSLWPAQLVGCMRARRQLKVPRVITIDMYNNYLVLGLLSSFISLSRMIGLSVLSPIVYVICANTEIVWETFMTRTLLKKKVTSLQYSAVLLVLLAIPLSIYDPATKSFGQENDDESSGGTSGLVLGISLSLASRFASSLNTILAERFLGEEKKTKIGVSECAVANAIIPFFTIPIVLAFNNEYSDWAAELSPTKASVGKKIAIVVLCVALACSKQIDRLSKFGIVQASSTIFFAGVDAAMKIVAGLGAFFFFSEKITLPKIVAFALIALSVLVLFYDKRQKIQAVEKYISTHLSTLAADDEEVAKAKYAVQNDEHN